MLRRRPGKDEHVGGQIRWAKDAWRLARKEARGDWRALQRTVVKLRRWDWSHALGEDSECLSHSSKCHATLICHAAPRRYCLRVVLVLDSFRESLWQSVSDSDGLVAHDDLATIERLWWLKLKRWPYWVTTVTQSNETSSQLWKVQERNSQLMQESLQIEDLRQRYWAWKVS